MMTSRRYKRKKGSGRGYEYTKRWIIGKHEISFRIFNQGKKGMFLEKVAVLQD
jgi:hypothetical protein